MNRVRSHSRAGFTLLELTLVIGILVAIASLVMPTFIRQIERAQLPESARRLRSQIALVRANAAYDGKRYRIRFPVEDEDETDPLGGDRQPIIEREDDPIEEPDEFNLVTAPWAVGVTLLDGVWCPEVRLGKPTIESVRDARERRSLTEDDLEEEFREFQEFDPQRPPLFVEPDGTSEWATFVLTGAPRDMDFDELEDEPQIEVILDGPTGLAWLQRPFYDEELDLFEEHGWPAVLRRDFLDRRVLTEDDVLEILPFPAR